MDRRRFVEMVAGSLAAVPLSGGCAVESSASDSAGRAQGRPIGLQLYTVRRQMQQDFAGTLARVAEIGYREVEFAGYFGQSPGEVRRALDAAGLVAPAAHIDIRSLDEDRWGAVLADALVMGHRYLVVASTPSSERTLDGYQRLAARFTRAGEQARRAGIRFAYHNHDYEFTPIDDMVPYDILLGQTDVRAVEFELDLYWVTRGGARPLDYFERWPGRFPLIHVKDMDDTPARGMTEVGSGVIDFAAIVARARQAGIRHWFVEHDNPASPMESIAKSHQGMVALLR